MENISSISKVTYRNIRDTIFDFITPVRLSYVSSIRSSKQTDFFFFTLIPNIYSRALLIFTIIVRHMLGGSDLLNNEVLSRLNLIRK